MSSGLAASAFLPARFDGARGDGAKPATISQPVPLSSSLSRPRASSSRACGCRRGGAQRLRDAGQRRLARVRPEDRARLRRQPVDRAAQGCLGGIEVGPAALRDARLLGIDDPLAGVEEKVDVAALLVRELVDRPRHERRLAEGANLGCSLAVAGLPQRPHERVTLADELLARSDVEAVDVVVEVDVHAGATTSPSRSVVVRREITALFRTRPTRRLSRAPWLGAAEGFAEPAACHARDPTLTARNPTAA